MNDSMQNEKWVWVAVFKGDDGTEQMLGQYDEEKDVSFIPAFMDKEEALRSLNSLTLDKSRKYEVEAIPYKDLARQSSERGFMILILDLEGRVVQPEGF